MTRRGADVMLRAEERAGSRLADFVDKDVRVLRRVRARVLRAANERATDLTDRAVRTLRAALK